jgi:hypothetical protein
MNYFMWQCSHGNTWWLKIWMVSYQQ